MRAMLRLAINERLGIASRPPVIGDPEGDPSGAAHSSPILYLLGAERGSRSLPRRARRWPRGAIIGVVCAVLLTIGASVPVQTAGAPQRATPPRASHSDWASGHYGLMSHFVPYAASIEDYNRVVDAFDVKAYADDVAQSGARYVIFTLGQEGFFCSPNRTLDGLCGPVTSQRDLIADVADALAAKGVRTVAYLPSGAPAPMAAGTLYGDVDSGGPGRRRAFQVNWQRAISEYSRRWGKRVSGWWLDGMYDWQKMYAFPDAPNYRSLADACRAGNPLRLVAFNDGEGPYSNHSEFGDWTAGEIHRHEQSLLECEGRWVTGHDPATGHPFRLQWNLHTFLGHEFVGNGFGGPRDTPRFSDAFITGFVRRVTGHGGTCQFDVPLHMGGPTDPDASAEGHLGTSFLPQLRAIARTLAANGGAPDHGPNIALKMPSAAGSADASPSALGNDGDLRTDFTSGENDRDVPWWQVDLGSAKQITAVQVVLSQAEGDKKYRTEIQVQASNDPSFRSFDVIAWAMEGTEIPAGGDFYAFLLKPSRYRYLRVSRPPKDYHVFWWKPGLRFSEFRVFSGG